MRVPPKQSGMEWWGKGPDTPWAEPWEPFELLPRDREDYPTGTADVVDWLKGRAQPTFCREDVSRIARQFGLYDRQHKGYRKFCNPTVMEALEILEVYDYIRSVRIIVTKQNRFLVNPGLLPADAVDDAVSCRRKFSHDQKRELWFLARGRCSICRVRLGPDWHADHVAPWSKGGQTTVENGMALCPTCNLRKNAKDFGGDQ
jgi:hypothetical protein